MTPMISPVPSATRSPLEDRPVTDNDYRYFYTDMTARDFYAGVQAGTLTFAGNHTIS